MKKKIALVSHKSPKHNLSTYQLMRAQQRRAALTNIQNEMPEAARVMLRFLPRILSEKLHEGIGERR